MVNSTTVIVCILLIVAALKEGAQSQISINVTVTTSEPTEGFRVAFICDFSINTEATLANVLWRYGTQLSNANSIVDWRSNAPEDVTYGPGYSAPRHQMSIADIYFGQTVLSIDPVQLPDEGRYWCEVVFFGDSDNTYADIQVKDAQPLQVTVSVEGGTNEVVYGSPVSLICEYTYDDTDDTVLSIAWLVGEMEGDLTPIATYIPPLNPPISYPGNSYQPPAYEMNVDEGNGRGRSDFMIQSVDWVDGDGPFWCTVAFDSGLVGTESVFLSVIEADGIHHVAEGDTLTMSCTLSGTTSTLVAYAWRKYDAKDNPITVTYWDILVEFPQNGDGFPYPDYEMTIDPTTGSSNLTIASIKFQDGGTYLCDCSYVPTPPGGNPKKEIRVIVSGLTGNSTTTTPASQTFTPSSSLETTTYEYKTTDIIGYLEIIRVESNLVEIGWESFQTDVDDVDKYRVFYTAISSQNQNDNNAIFVDVDQPGVNISSLTPDTIYSVLVEASTTQGTLINVGSIEVKTISSELDGFPLPIVISVTVAVTVAVIVGVILVCRLRSRRTSKTPALTKTIQPVYDDVPADNGVYEDLQPVTEQIRRTNQRPTENITKNSGQQIVYEVSPSSTGYDEITNKRQKQPEYLEIYNTAPKADDESVKEKSAPYMSLDKHTMEKSNIKYEIPDPKPEYLQLLTTTTVDDPDSVVSQGPDAGTYEIPVPEYLEFDSPSLAAENTNLVPDAETYEIPVPEYLEFDSPSPAAENTNLVPDAETYEIPGPEYLELDNPTPALEDASLKTNPEYMALDQNTMNKPATYQSIVTDKSHENISTI